MLVRCIDNDNIKLPITINRPYYDYRTIDSQDTEHYIILNDICRIQLIEQKYFEVINTEKPDL